MDGGLSILSQSQGSLRLDGHATECSAGQHRQSDFQFRVHDKIPLCGFGQSMSACCQVSQT